MTILYIKFMDGRRPWLWDECCWNAMTARPRNIAPGRGEIEIESILNSSSIATLSSTYPLRLISPPARTSSRAAIVFILTYGGGLVARDHVDVHVRVRPRARLGLLSQGSTKIYKTPSKDICTEQLLTATIDEGAALLQLPDPVQPFKGSSYRQSQSFYVHPQHSNLVLLDWVSAGRTARGEGWNFFQWKGRNEVWSLPIKTSTGKMAPKKLLMRDNIVLDGMSPMEQSYRDEMDNLGVFGTLIIRGPVFQTLGQLFMKEFSSQPRIRGSSLAPTSPSSRLTWTAASMRGFVIVKFGAREVDEAKRWLREMLECDGTVEREFGQHSLMCLQ